MNPNKDRLVSKLEALIFDEMRDFQAESRRWEQKYHSAMAANKRLDEQNEGLRVEKQALLDVLSEWKSEVQSLNALNTTLSEELGVLKKELANAEDARNIHYRAKLDQGKTITNLAAEVVELKKDSQTLTKTVQSWQRNYTSTKHELDLAQKELAEDNAEKLRLHCLLQSRTEELEKKEKDWSAAFAAAEERHEEFKKKSDEILATMEENLQKKQETIQALTGWKTGAASALDSLEKRLKNAKDVIHTQENIIEWLDGKVKRLKEKKAKKEQND